MTSRIVSLLVVGGLLTAAWRINADDVGQPEVKVQTLTLRAVPVTDGSVVELRFGDLVLQTQEFTIMKADQLHGTVRASGDKLELRHGDTIIAVTSVELTPPAELRLRAQE
jgi:hypothetical protein